MSGVGNNSSINLSFLSQNPTLYILESVAKQQQTPTEQSKKLTEKEFDQIEKHIKLDGKVDKNERDYLLKTLSQGKFDEGTAIKVISLINEFEVDSKKTETKETRVNNDVKESVKEVVNTSNDTKQVSNDEIVADNKKGESVTIDSNTVVVDTQQQVATTITTESKKEESTYTNTTKYTGGFNLNSISNIDGNLNSSSSSEIVISLKIDNTQVINGNTYEAILDTAYGSNSILNADGSSTTTISNNKFDFMYAYSKKVFEQDNDTWSNSSAFPRIEFNSKGIIPLLNTGAINNREYTLGLGGDLFDYKIYRDVEDKKAGKNPQFEIKSSALINEVYTPNPNTGSDYEDRISATANVETTWKPFYYLSSNIQPLPVQEKNDNKSKKTEPITINVQDNPAKVSFSPFGKKNEGKVIQVDSNGNEKDITPLPLQNIFTSIPEGVAQPIINSTLGVIIKGDATLQQYSTLAGSNSIFNVKINYNIPINPNIAVNFVLKDDTYTTNANGTFAAEEKKYVSIDFNI